MWKYYSATLLAYFDFWIVLAIPYMTYRGLSLQTALFLLSVYALSITILEYPTGVIGDTWGHKKSVLLGLTSIAISYLILSFAINPWMFFCGMFFRALGISLKSGSSEAILKQNVANFKKTYAKLQSSTDIMLFIAASSAGILASISFEFTLMLNAMTLFVCTLLMSQIPYTRSQINEHEGNIYYFAKESLRTIKNSRPIIATMFLLMILIGYAGGVKTFLGIVSDTYQINVEYLGVFIGFGMLARSAGKYLSSHVHSYRYNEASLIGIVAALLITGFLNSPIIFMIGLILTNSIVGFSMTSFRSQLIDSTKADVRASVFSMASLIASLMVSFNLGLAAVLTQQIGFKYVLIVLATIFTGSIVIGRVILLPNFRHDKSR